mgnify:CR=1 FL=1
MWKDVPGWEGVYQVSDDGRVRSLTRRVLCSRFENDWRTFTGRELKAGIAAKGYLMVSLIAPQREREYRYVHDLVLRAFVGDPPPERRL